MSKTRKQTRGRPNGGDPKPPRWQPMVPTVRPPMSDGQRANILRAVEGDSDQAAKIIDGVMASELWTNDRYRCSVRRRDEDGSIYELSIQRADRRAVHDWRDFQRIKNEVCGPEVEAFELYPAESRLVDTANQYWLYVLPPGDQMPAGMNSRAVTDMDQAATVGAIQRPLPDDWKPTPDLIPVEEP